MTSLEFNISIFLSTFLELTKHVISARNNSETAVSLVNYLQNINVSNSLVNLNLNPKYWQTVRKLLGKIHFFKPNLDTFEQEAQGKFQVSEVKWIRIVLGTRIHKSV